MYCHLPTVSTQTSGGKEASYFSILDRLQAGPSHCPGSGLTLDLIITRSSDDVVLASPKATFPISDHFIIQYPIGFPRPALSCKELSFRKLKNIDIAEFSADIASAMLCASVHWDNIDALSDCFNMTPTNLAPSSSKKLKS